MADAVKKVKPQVVSDEAWEEARKLLLAKEIAHSRALYALNAERQQLPWRLVAKEYTFQEAGSGKSVPLGKLFTHGDQLVIQHMMFDPSWEKPCPNCTTWTETYAHILPYLNQRAAFHVVAAASAQQLDAFRSLKGWKDLRMFSAAGTTFNADFRVGFTAEQCKSGEKLYNYGKSAAFCPELFGFSVFTKGDDGSIYHTYSTYGPGLSELSAPLKFFDLLPRGREETSNLNWVKHIEDY